MKKILSLYDGMSNTDLYELAQICVNGCKKDLRAVEKSMKRTLDDMEQLDISERILKLPVRK